MIPKELDSNDKEIERLPFLRFNYQLSKKSQENKLGSIIRYESI
jgi:hypothetical protein